MFRVWRERDDEPPKWASRIYWFFENMRYSLQDRIVARGYNTYGQPLQSWKWEIGDGEFLGSETQTMSYQVGVDWGDGGDFTVINGVKLSKPFDYSEEQIK